MFQVYSWRLGESSNLLPKLVMEVEPFQLVNMKASVENLTSLLKELGYGPGKQVDATDWEWTIK